MSNFYATLRSLFLRNERLSSVSLGGIMLLSTVIMGIISLASLNDKAMKGYMLNKLETERQELVTDGEVTDMLTLRARSMSAVEESVSGMVKPNREDITYVMPMTVAMQN